MPYFTSTLLFTSILFIFSTEANCSLARQIATYQTQISTLKSSLKNKEDEYLTLKVAISNLERELYESKKQKQYLQGSLIEAQAKQEQLLVTYDALKARLEYVASECVEINHKKEKSDESLKLELEKKEQALQQLDEVKLAFYKINEKLKKELIKEKKLQNMYEKCKEKKESLDSQVETLKNEKILLSKKIEEQKQLLRIESEETQSQLQAFEEQEKTFKSALEILASENEKQCSILKEKFEYDECLRSQIREVAEVIGANGNETPPKVIPQLKEAFLNAQAKVIECEAEVETLRAQIDSLTKQFNLQDLNNSGQIENNLPIDVILKPTSYPALTFTKRELQDEIESKQETRPVVFVNKVSIYSDQEFKEVLNIDVPNGILNQTLESTMDEVTASMPSLSTHGQEIFIKNIIEETGELKGCPIGWGGIMREMSLLKVQTDFSKRYAIEKEIQPFKNHFSYSTHRRNEERWCVLY
jgi:hypothetical protein